MNIEERAAQAAAWKAAGQCNCAQAVLKAFEDKLPVDTDTLMKLGRRYGLHGKHLRRIDRRSDGGRRRHQRQGHAPYLQGIAAKLSGKVRRYHL